MVLGIMKVADGWKDYDDIGCYQIVLAMYYIIWESGETGFYKWNNA